MKSTQILFFVLFSILIIGCTDNNRSTTTQGKPLPPPTTFQPPDTQTNTTSTTAASTTNVQHYICANNCEGSGGSVSGTCPVCGSEYTHNAAFHAQPAQTTTTTTDPTTTITPSTPLPTPTAPANANGVFHYTCSAGCEGGAATAGTCTSCGGALAHNAAFHQ